MVQSISIHQVADSGNISAAIIDQQIQLTIEKDAASDFLQWFHFYATGIRGKSCTFTIVNAGETTYPKGWEGYAVATSFDRQCWTRTPANFDGKKLSWTIKSDENIVWFAYFAPYSMEQHLDLVAKISAARDVRYECLGTTYQGRTIDYLKLSSLNNSHPSKDISGSVRKQLWVIARQHPGESMAEWFMQGFLERLLDEDDAASRRLRHIADVHAVPNMNPDGSYLGHLRTNSLGVNLNREWESPCEKNSPEVFFVRKRMQQTGISLALDVHGDEALPYNFIAGTEGIESWTDSRNAQLTKVKRTWAALNPDFQTQHGYPITPKGKANLAICSNHLAQVFGCLSMTLEMPFKDTANNPRPDVGWSPERSMNLGASFVDVACLTLSQQLSES